METSSSQGFVGHAAPDFVLPSTKNLQTLAEPVRLADYAGKWLALLSYPLDFTFVCPAASHPDTEDECARALPSPHRSQKQ